MLEFIFGGVFRLIPEVMKMFTAKADRAHEVNMFSLQLDADKMRGNMAIERSKVDGDIAMQLAEMSALVAATNAQNVHFEKTGNKFLDFILVIAESASAFVRPLLTYWFCIAGYGAYKVASISMLFSQGVAWDKAVLQLWTPYDQSVTLSIIGFWFVDRAIRKQAK